MAKLDRAAELCKTAVEEGVVAHDEAAEDRVKECAWKAVMASMAALDCLLAVGASPPEGIPARINGNAERSPETPDRDIQALVRILAKALPIAERVDAASWPIARTQQRLSAHLSPGKEIAGLISMALVQLKSRTANGGAGFDDEFP